MDLPNEILLHVASYLSLKDKVTSTLVCKCWSEIFVSQLYEKIDLRPKKRDQEETSHPDESLVTSSGTDSNGNVPSEPTSLPMELIQKYGHFIRELTLVVPGPHLRELPPSVDALLRLNLEPPAKQNAAAYSSLDRQGLSRLLIINPQIQHISLNKLTFLEAPKLFRQVAEFCLQLRSLEVFDSRFRSLDMISTIQKNPNLKRLTFTNNDRYYRFSTPTPHSWQDPIPSMGSLLFGYSDCRLKMRKTDQFKTLLFSVPITQLKIMNYNMDEDDLTAALDSWPQVQHLILECSGFSSKSMNALGRHFNHLHTLDLVNSEEFLTWMCEVVFAACPQLVDLGMCFVNMDSLLEEEMQDGKEPSVVSVMKILQINVDNVSPHSWACVGLQRFRVACMVWPETEERRKRAADQLLALKRLKHLQFEEVMGRHSKSTPNEGDSKIYWKQVDFERWQLEQDTETKWMTNAWPDLQSFRMMTGSFSTAASYKEDN